MTRPNIEVGDWCTHIPDGYDTPMIVEVDKIHNEVATIRYIDSNSSFKVYLDQLELFWLQRNDNVRSTISGAKSSVFLLKMVRPASYEVVFYNKNMPKTMLVEVEEYWEITGNRLVNSLSDLSGSI